MKSLLPPVRPQRQLNKHDPDNGVYGDCARTCIAMVLGLNAEEVPHFLDPAEFPGDDWTIPRNAWLAERGLAYLTMPIWGEWGWKFVTNILRQQPAAAFIITGQSPRGEWNHDIVWYRGEVLDPHPDATGLIGPCIPDAGAEFGERWFWINTIAPLNGTP